VNHDAPAEPPSDEPSLPDPAAAGSAGARADASTSEVDGSTPQRGGSTSDQAGGGSGPAGWRPTRWSREAIDLLPDLGRLLRELVNDERVPRRAKIVAGAAAAYVASPVDLLPDVIPTVGGIDDLVVVLGAVRYLVATAGYDLVRELWTGNDAGFSLVIVLAGVKE
jgi:uncharacterized membrane protein YkvA (DUF1232 family)